ncbi:MAG: aconitase/3-isopropylmalate dehydratase large subunit family protein [Planctomycetota bacterium]|nr:aconitase/3-isopropylmalate dehydratase large subunit family protein [Planctomycetota bacterium]
MGRTLIEKIIGSHTDQKVRPGNIVWMDLDVRSARDFGGGNVVANYHRHYGDQPVADVEKTFFTFDCNAPANTIPYAQNQRACREFAREQGIKVFDVDSGIGTHVLLEEGKITPGCTAVGTDSHFNIMGAAGAFGQGMGDSDIAYAFRYGRTWFEVPQSIKVTLEGQPSIFATARDVVFAVLRHFGSSGALGRAVELYGPAIDELDLSGRITVASQGTEMGAISLLLTPTDAVLEELSRGPDSQMKAVTADDDAEYEQTHTINVEGLGPLMAAPPSPTNIVEVKEVENRKVDAVFIGSCTNGRYEDIVAAAKVLKGSRVADGVNVFVVPSSRKIFMRLLSEGWLEALMAAGAVVSNPSCAGCASGQIGMTGSGETMVSTSNRNYKGKQGAGNTYLASPVTAAKCALAGCIKT